MASDDCSESGEMSIPIAMKKMARVDSSNSLSTMVSDAHTYTEDSSVHFELDIEAGAEAAQKYAESGGSMSPCRKWGGSSVVIPEMSHSQVPRNTNMEERYNSSRDEPITTMMIRNIPGRYSQHDLMLDLKELGLAGTYDFLYMPMDKGTAANVGYAFVNFVTPAWAEACMRKFSNFRFVRHQRSSNKLATVSVAHLQGLQKNLQHYEHAAVNMSREKRRRPVVMANIAKIFG
jgi:hypothetical protein